MIFIVFSKYICYFYLTKNVWTTNVRICKSHKFRESVIKCVSTYLVRRTKKVPPNTLWYYAMQGCLILKQMSGKNHQCTYSTQNPKANLI